MARRNQFTARQKTTVGILLIIVIVLSVLFFWVIITEQYEFKADTVQLPPKRTTPTTTQSP